MEVSHGAGLVPEVVQRQDERKYQLGRGVSPFLEATKALRESRDIALLCF
jgi:hypothetical protein